ncbi:MAG: hypothetical protein WA871_13000, partial [Candidatus Acidiferrales bacterium]
MFKQTSRIASRREALLLGGKLAAGAAVLGPLNLLRPMSVFGARVGGAQSSGAAPRVFDVRDYGAIGDGTTLDTAAI